MISPRDLTTLRDVKEYIAPKTASTADDAVLQRLIGRATDWILKTELSRELALGSYNERRNGTGTSSIMCRHYPIVAVQAVWIDNCQVPAALMSAGGESLTGGGQVNDSRFIYLRNREFCRGTQNVLIQYQAGYLTPGVIELATLPAWQAQANYPKGGQLAPAGAGFTYLALNPGVSGATPPTWPTQLSATVQDGTVLWVAAAHFAGIVPGTEMLPEAVQFAAIELVALGYRRRGRVGDTGTGMGPERVNYFAGAMDKSTKDSIKGFRDVVPVWDAPAP
jgi:hypothetical protein